MIVRLFKTNHAVIVLFLVVVCVVLNLSYFWFSGNGYAQHHYSLITGSFFENLSKNKWISGISFIFLTLLGAIYFNFLMERYNMMRKQSFLPAMFFVVLMSSLPEFLSFIQGIIANIFLLFSINRLLSISLDQNAASPVFDAMFLISIGSLFYFPIIIFFPCVFIALMVYKTFHWREWVVGLIGLGLPYLFAFVYCFFFDTTYLIAQHVQNTLSIKSSWPEFQFLSTYFLVTILAIILLLGLMPFVKEINQNKVKIRKSLIVMIWFLILSFLAPVVFNFYGSSTLIFSVIPLSLYFSSYFLNLRIPILAELLFSLLVMLIIINQLNFI